MMKLFLACVAILFLASEVKPQRPSKRIRLAFQEFVDIGVIKSIPSEELPTTFGDVRVTLGIELSENETQSAPTFDFEIDPTCYYVLGIIDVDCVSAENPFLRSCLLYLAANIVDNLTIENSCVIAQYIGPNPGCGTGPHRYLVLLYKQENVIDIAAEEIAILDINRNGFNFTEFADNNSLYGPIAGNTFVVEDTCLEENL